MTLNRNRWIVRYYLWLVRLYRDEWVAEYRASHGTSLCMFFWRIVLGSAGIAAAASVGVALVWLLVMTGIREPLSLLAGVGFVIAILVLPLPILWMFSFTGKFMRSENMLSGYLKAAKRGICPLIKFDGEQR